MPVKVEANDQLLVARYGNVGDNIAEEDNAVGGQGAETHANVNEVFLQIFTISVSETIIIPIVN